ncbi:hypothetical protein, partial [Providencia rettgeri]|uniref:hypothetical protein n=1 Tax=Providencia rettgeri TaxID=587 RepID=UPI00301A8745
RQAKKRASLHSSKEKPLMQLCLISSLSLHHLLLFIIVDYFSTEIHLVNLVAQYYWLKRN